MALFNTKDSDTLSTKPKKSTGLNDDLYSEFEEFGINLTEPARRTNGSNKKNRAGNYEKAMARNEELKRELFANPEPTVTREAYEEHARSRVSERQKWKKGKAFPGKRRDNVSRQRRRSGTTKKSSLLKKILAILILLVILFIAFVVMTLGKINKDNVDESALGIVPVEGYTNILLLGVDTRDMNDTEGTRTDAIMIVSINDKTGDLTMTSVYRDTYLKMGETDDYDKITHAHAYGGPEMVMRSLNDALDLDIEDYMLVNFKGVAEGIDRLGGIEVDVEDYEIEELNKYTAETAYLLGRNSYRLVEEPGTQTLDGCQAVSYGRIRKGVGDDFKRTARMRTVMSKVIDKVEHMGLVRQVAFLNKVLPETKTDMGSLRILKYALKLKKMKMQGSEGFPYNVTTGSRYGASYVFSTNLAADVTQMHNEVFGDAEYVPSETVEAISYNASAY